MNMQPSYIILVDDMGNASRAITITYDGVSPISSVEFLNTVSYTASGTWVDNDYVLAKTSSDVNTFTLRKKCKKIMAGGGGVSDVAAGTIETWQNTSYLRRAYLFYNDEQ